MNERLMGRPIKYNKEYVEALLKELQASSISMRGLCKQKQIPVQSLNKALKRLGLTPSLKK
jgi:lambda repressor-like predicted transcriptional regulator